MLARKTDSFVQGGSRAPYAAMRAAGQPPPATIYDNLDVSHRPAERNIPRRQNAAGSEMGYRGGMKIAGELRCSPSAGQKSDGKPSSAR
jgi:hypothetical protein